MSPLLTNPTEFGALLQRFFADRLIQQQNVSPRTIAAYRDTFRLFLNYAGHAAGKPPAKLALCDIDANLVLLDSTGHCNSSSSLRAGVWKPSVFRGRLLSFFATRLRSA